MKSVLVIVMLSGLLLSACGRQATPDLEATVQAAVAAALTAQVTPTPMPTATLTPTTPPTETATPVPTETPTPVPTDTPAPPPTETLALTQASALVDTPLPTDTPAPTDTPVPTATETPEPTPTATPIIHIVQPGETLRDIARAYGVSPVALADANDMADPNVLEEGQGLLIPTPTLVASPTPPAPEDTQTAANTPPQDLPDQQKALVIATALQLQGSVQVKGARISREPDKELILLVIETQSQQDSVVNETTLKEAITSFIYAYQGGQRLEVEAKYVVVQAQDQSGTDRWYAVATMDDIGLLTNGQLALSDFVQRIKIGTP
jgi:LysM repeat protein